MSKIKIIWKSNSPDKKQGYLRVSERLTDLGKTKITSLKLPPIHKRHWDDTKQRVRHTHPEYLFYNEKIEKYFNKYSVAKRTDFISDEKKSLVFFVENKLLPICKSVGTSQKYKNILFLVKLFNKTKFNKEDVLFKDINEDFINEWIVWLKNERGIVENSISYKTKTFKSFISKSINQSYYIYYPNPFNNIKTPVKRIDVDFLDEEQINSIMFSELYDVIKGGSNKGKKREIDSRYKQDLSINDVRNFFLWQFFNHGERVSDLMTIRWNNLNINGNEIRIKKTMLKTKYPTNKLLYYKPLMILFHYVPDKFISDRIKETYQNIRELNNAYGVFFMKNNIKVNYNFINQNVKVPIVNLDSKFSRYFKDLSKEDNSTLISLRLCDKAINFLTEKKTKIYDKSYSDGLFEFIGVKNDEVKKTIHIKKMLQNDDELIYLRNLRNLVEEKVNIRIKNRLKKIEDLYLNLYNEMIIIVKEILMDDEYSNNFIFPLLDNKDFVDITNEKMFAKMNEKQYNKLAGRRSYYNQLLKIMGKQIGIPNLTSHKSRHSYTSILIKNNKDINLYDLSVSLGHQHISTTQTYIQSFINTRIDDMGKKLSDSFGNIGSE
jgi:integrase